MADAEPQDAMMYFMGPDDVIMGESQDYQLRDNNAFDLTEFTVKGENSTNIGSSTSGAGGAGKVKFDRLTLKKYSDKATTGFFKAMIEGTHFTDAVIELRRNGQTYLRFDFKMCIIAEVETSQSGEDEAEDSIVCDYGALKITYYTQNSETGDLEEYQYIEFSRVTNEAVLTVT